MPIPIRWYGDRQHYSAWVEAHDTLTDQDRHTIRERIGRLNRSALFSIVLLPTADTARSVPDAVVASVHGQLYPHWELWLPEDLGTTDADRRLRRSRRTADHPSHFCAAVAAADGAF